MTDLNVLAERVEREAPSRELDTAVWIAIGLTEKQEAHCAAWCRQYDRIDLTRTMYLNAWSPKFTSSVDAALNLIPEGYTWTIDGGACPTSVRLESQDSGRHFESDAMYGAAAALTAACLRARAAMEGQP